jgi:oxygen-independent coproporphyrinogen-3 oxidase
MQTYIESLKKEILLKKTSEKVDTIFFGGGTPSILSKEQFCDIANFIKNNFVLTKNCEWTIEVNPESFSEEKAQNWLENGVNRLSVGVQSLNDNELKICGRIHNKELALDVLKNDILQKFSSINVDLIYGLPAQNAKSFAETLKIITKIPAIKHISLYELTIAKNSNFGRNFENYDFLNETKIEEIIEISKNILKKCDFERYEVSNFAKNGYRCRHNENYWKGKKYIGFGTAAHSFDGNVRSANFSDLQRYIKCLSGNVLAIDFQENLYDEQKKLEFLMLRLRTIDGFSISGFRRKFKTDFLLKNEKYVQKLIKNGYMVIENGICKLTDKGLDIADGVAVRL